MSEQQQTIKYKQQVPFSQIRNDFLCSNKISGVAKALWCVLYSKPLEWTFYWPEILSNMKEKRDCVKNAGKELEDLGYMLKKQKRIPTGRGKEWKWGGMDISLFFDPLANPEFKPSEEIEGSRPLTENPLTGFPSAGSAITGNASTKKQRNNKDLLNKDLDNSFFSFEKIKKYFSDNNLKSDPEEFRDHWESVGWMKGKNKITNVEAEIRRWERKHKNMYPEKHKTTLNISNSDSTVAQSDPIKINNDDPLWLKLSEVLKSDFEKDVYEKWLSELNFVNVINGNITLAAPNKFKRDWIKREYLTKIKSSFQQTETGLKSIKIINVEPQINN